jgi:hypothetical protein
VHSKRSLTPQSLPSHLTGASIERQHPRSQTYTSDFAVALAIVPRRQGYVQYSGGMGTADPTSGSSRMAWLISREAFLER